MRDKLKKAYLGDAVYAEADDTGNIVLTTADGCGGTSNKVWLQPEVLVSLIAFAQRYAGLRFEKMQRGAND